MTETTTMPPFEQTESLAADDAFELYLRALAAHRQQNPPLTFAGFHAAQFEADVRHRD